MADFEREIVGEIPIGEAAAFFVNTKSFSEFEKLGSRVQDTIAELLAGKMPEKKAGIYRMAKTAKAEKKTKKELKQIGKERGVTALAAEAEREKGRRGVRAGTLLGQAAGALGGAAAGKKYIGGKVGPAAGLISGASVGKRLGHELGTEVDIAKSASAREASMRSAFKKLGYSPANEDGQPIEGTSGAQPMAQGPAPAPQQAPSGAPVASGPMKPPTMPVNYLQSEMAGQRAQEANESTYYRQIAQQAEAQVADMQQQIMQTQAQLEGLNQQAAATAGQVQLATQSAQDSQDRATQHSMEAANMRMAAQRMREAMFELAQQEPESFSPAGQQAAAAQEMAEAQSMEPGATSTPEGAPEPGAAPGAVPDEAGGEFGEPVEQPASGQAGATGKGNEGAERTVTVKTSAIGQTGKALLAMGAGAAAGAGLGALSAKMRMSRAEKLRQAAESLQSKGPPGNFREAMYLARTQAQAEEANIMRQYPGPAMMHGAGRGAMQGALILPGQVAGGIQAGRGMIRDIGELRGG